MNTLPMTRVHFAAVLLGYWRFSPAQVNRIVAACDEARALRKAGLDPHLGVMLAKALANTIGADEQTPPREDDRLAQELARDREDLRRDFEGTEDYEEDDHA